MGMGGDRKKLVQRQPAGMTYKVCGDGRVTGLKSCPRVDLSDQWAAHSRVVWPHTSKHCNSG